MARVPVVSYKEPEQRPTNPGLPSPLMYDPPSSRGPQLAYDDDDTLGDPTPVAPATFFGTSGTSGDYDFVQRIDTPLSETIETSFNEAWDRRSMAVTGALKDQYQSLIDETEKATGRRIFNPYSESGYGRREIIERRERGEDVSGINQQTAAVERFHRELAELRKEFPELAMRSHDDIVSAVQQARAEVRRRRADAAAGETGFLSGAAAFVGSTGAAFTDPVNIITLPMGAPWAAGILRAVAVEAGIGLASEATVQTLYQGSRAQIGERADLGEAAGDVLAVGATAGVLGGTIRGAVRGVEYLRARRAALEHAESIPAAERTPDLDAAIAVERRALDVDDANPYGRDVNGSVAHAERYAAAERAIDEGRAVPRLDDAGGAPAASPSDVAAIRELAEVARDPAAITARLEALKAVPREAVEHIEAIDQGYVSIPDGTAIPRGLEVVMNLEGRPTIARVAELSPAPRREDFANDADFRKAEAVHNETVAQHRAAQEFVAGRRSAAEIPATVASAARTVSALRRAGIDLAELEPAEAAARLRTLGERIEQSQRNRSATGAAPEPRADPEAERLTEARTQEAQISTAAEREAELDAVREEQIKREFAGRENETVNIEDETGTIRPMTVREVFESIEREADEMEALHLCIAGGVKKPAGIVGAVKNLFGVK